MPDEVELSLSELPSDVVDPISTCTGLPVRNNAAGHKIWFLTADQQLQLPFET